MKTTLITDITIRRPFLCRKARQMHVSQDWAKALERQGVDRLIDRIDV